MTEVDPTIKLSVENLKKEVIKQKMKRVHKKALCLLLALLMTLMLFPLSQAEAVTADEPKTIMVVAPHQDDEANMANAVMYSHAKRGDDVYVVMGFGSDPTGTEGDSYGLARLRESKKNLEKLGIPADHLIYLGYQKIDYAAQAYTDKTIKLGSEGEMLRTDGTSYYTYSHEEEGFPSYHSQITGEECKASEANLIADIVSVIKQYRPDELYVINYDRHLEHMWLASVIDQAFGVLKQEAGFEDYCPRYYQSMSYQSAWQASKDFLATKSPNDRTRIFLESTISFTPRNTTFTWGDRIRFPVEDEMSMPDLEKNLSAQAYIYGFGTRVYNPSGGNEYMLGCINGDQVFWERDTHNLAYQAAVTVSSNTNDGGKVNDFSTLRMPLTSFLTYKTLSPDISCSQYKWSPDSTDAEKTVTLTFDTPQAISSVKLYDDYDLNNQITAGSLTFSDGSTVKVGPLNNNGGATTVTFPEKAGITSVSFQITAYTGTPGLAEFEVYAPTEPRETDFIQIYLDKVNGSNWANKSFLYDYPVNVTSQKQTMQLGVYCYPNEAAPSDYIWELSSDAQGITLTQEGLLTVTTDAASGSYQIQVTAKDDTNLTDIMTIQVKGKINIDETCDINMDGLCDYRDLAYVLMGLDGFYQDCADVNGDGVINEADVAIIREQIKLENQ